MKEITEDTFVGYDHQGNEIRAENLQKWAYNQLKASGDMYEALKGILLVAKPRTENSTMIFEKEYQGGFVVLGNRLNDAVEALAKAEER